MRRFSRYLVLTTLCLLVACAQAGAKQPAAGAGYTLVANAPGSATLVSPGYLSTTAVQLVSTGASGWGAIGFASSGLKLRNITHLSTEYAFTLGSCWGGSPRFTVGLSNGGTKEIYFYMGPPPSYTGCPTSGWVSTGNLASPSGFVDDSHLPGGSPTDTYADALSKYGGYNVAYIAIDFDSGWVASQTAEFDDTQVNSTLYTYEP